MAPPKEKKAKKKDGKSSYQLLKEGFQTIKVLDNTNVYGVVFSECISNIFKEGMWQRVLTPYILFLANHDKATVGNAITINSTIRAVVGVLAGRVLINRFGCDSVFAMTGLIGIIGIITNFFCLLNSSLTAVFILNAVWGVYTGLWNSCLEVAWARSLIPEHREDASNARQVTNKGTASAGPLLSLMVFYALGDNWSMPLVTTVLLLGTTFTILPVILCFRFDRVHEIRQELKMVDIDRIDFPGGVGMRPAQLTRNHFFPMDNGPMRLSYPLKDTSKYGKLRVFTPDLKETNFILGKQFRAWLKDPEADIMLPFSDIGVVHFMDPSRISVRASFESYSLFLKKEGGLNLSFSQCIFYLNPDLGKRSQKASEQIGFFRGCKKLFLSGSARELDDVSPLQESLLSGGASSISADMFEKKKKGGKDKDKQYEPNIFKANIIVTCDVINAVASGMSLKFMDIFLIETYGVMPTTLLFVQVLQNMSTAFLTPIAKQTLTWVWKHGYKKAFGVVLIWAAGCFFMTLICIPNMPLPITIASIVLMNSLFSCTKAYNRARLINALPHDRVANYMVWDSLNKANQGGITILGAQVVAWGGYRACFLTTLALLCLRLLIYFIPILRKGIRRKIKVDPDLESSIATPSVGAKPMAKPPSLVLEIADGNKVSPEEEKLLPALKDHDDEHFDEHFSHDEHHDDTVGQHGEVDSELFTAHAHHAPEPNELLIVDTDADGAEEPLSPDRPKTRPFNRSFPASRESGEPVSP